MKIDFTVTYNNGDTQHTHTESATVESDDAEFVVLCNQLENAENASAVLEYLHRAMNRGTVFYDELLKIFDRRGHIKLDWDDVMVSFNSVTVNGKSFEISEETIPADFLYNTTSVQLYREDYRVQMDFIENYP